MWKKYTEVVFFSLQNYVPVKSRKAKKTNPWITRKIIHAKRKAKRLRKTLKLKPTYVHALNTSIKDMKSKIKAAKDNYFSKTLPNFLKSAPQKFWNYLNPKHHDSPATDSDDNRNAANSFNSYFQSVFNTDNGKQPNVVSYDRTPAKPLEIADSGLLNLLLNIDTKRLDLITYQICFLRDMRSGMVNTCVTFPTNHERRAHFLPSGKLLKSFLFTNVVAHHRYLISGPFP